MSQLRLDDLIDAAKANNCKALGEILQKFPSQVDYEHGGVTALQQASYYGHIEAMKTLIRHGADLDISDFSNGSTPLHYAVDGNQPTAVKLLLNNRANVGEQNTEGLTPPQLAYRKKLKECIKEFITFNPQITFKTEETKIPVVKTVHSPAIPEKFAPSIEEREHKYLKKVDDADTCIYCSERTAFITFRPCNHVYSCFECSATQEVCRCGAPIDDRSIGDDNKVRRYIKDVKEFRRGYGESQHKLENLTKKVDDLKKRLEKSEEDVRCYICRDNPIDCVMSGCGHLFCRSCVRQWKNVLNPSYHTPFKCPECKVCSRYMKLYPRWDATSKVS